MILKINAIKKVNVHKFYKAGVPILS